MNAAEINLEWVAEESAAEVFAAGARETMRALLEELQARDIQAHVATVGCIGMCAREPLVDIEQAGKPRITYGNVTADRVSRLIEEHLINGNVVEEWAVGRLKG